MNYGAAIMKSDLRFWNGKKVLVTGATGFLGGWLCRELLVQNARVAAVSTKKNRSTWKYHKIGKKNASLSKLDVSNSDAVFRFFKKTKPDFCFHLAGISSPAYCDQHPLEAFQTNVAGSWNVLQACLKQKVPVLLVSTANVYGDCRKGVFSENSPVQVTDTYALTKILMESAAKGLCKTHGLRASIVRLTTLFGPVDLGFNRLVPKNTLSFIHHRQNYNNPRYLRDFLFVSDAVNGLLLAGKKTGFHCEIFNLSSEKAFFGKAVAKAIECMLQKEPVVLRPVKNCSISSRKARQALGWKTKKSISDALAETIGWYVKNSRALR